MYIKYEGKHQETVIIRFTYLSLLIYKYSSFSFEVLFFRN